MLSFTDKELLAMLYNNYYRALVGYATSILKDSTEGENAVQNVIFKAWEGKLVLENEQKLKTYLWHAVRNECVSMMRRQKTHQLYQQSVDMEKEVLILDDESESLDKEELYRRLFLAIDALPARQREIFLMVIKGKKNSEIAEALNISIHTVHSQRKAGMKTLREKLPIAPILISLLVNS